MLAQEEVALTAVAVIPAFNEASTVGNVVRASLRAEAVNAVVVVNDASIDNTSVVASEAADLERATLPYTKPFAVIDHAYNLGKAEAMRTGADYAKELGGTALKTVVFLDADSSPIWSRRLPTNRKLGRAIIDWFNPSQATAEYAGQAEEDFIDTLATHIDALVQPVVDGEQIMTIGIFERNKFIDNLKLHLDWGALSGNRAVDIRLWQDMLTESEAKSIQIGGWQAEAALNSYTRQRRSLDGVKLNRQIGKILMTDVVNIGSRVKTNSVIKGLMRMAGIHTRAMLGFAKFGWRL